MIASPLHAGQAGTNRTISSSLPCSAKMPCYSFAGSGMYRSLLLQARTCTHVSYVQSQRDASRNASNNDRESRSFQGVYRQGGRYRVQLFIDGVIRQFGTFSSKEEAARHRDMLVIRFFGRNGNLTRAALCEQSHMQALPRVRLNYPLSDYKQEDIMAQKSLEQYRKEWATKDTLGSAQKGQKPKSSRFEGVYLNSTRGAWMAKVRTPGKRVHVGHYPTEEEAARKYDEMAYRLLGDQAVLNFPQDIEQYKAAAAGPAPGFRRQKTSQYQGVNYHRKGGWEAYLRYGGNLVFYKWCRTEEEAAREYDQAVMRLLPENTWATKLNFKDFLNRRPPAT